MKSWGLIALLLLLPTRAFAAFAKVQQGAYGSAASGTTCVPGAINVTAGNLVVLLMAEANGSISSISGDASNTWGRAGSRCNNNASSGGSEIWYTVATVTQAMAPTVNVNASIRQSCVLVEFSGNVVNRAAVLEGTGACATGTTTSPATGAVTPNMSTDLTVGTIAQVTAESVGTGPTNGFSKLTTAVPNPKNMPAFQWGQTGSISYRFTGTPTSQASAGLLAVFRAASPAAGFMQ